MAPQQSKTDCAMDAVTEERLEADPIWTSSERSELGKELHEAPAMRFRRVAADSETVSKLVPVIEAVEMAAASTRKRVQSQKQRESFRMAVEAIAGELIEHHGWMRYTTREAAYTDQRVTYRHVMSAMDALAAAGLIERIEGNSQKRVFPFGTSFDRRAPRVKATQKLRDMLAGAEFKIEWMKAPPKVVQPIELRTGSTWGAGGKLRGKKLALPDTPRTQALTRDAESLNQFIAGFDIGACDAPAWRRIFHLPPGVPAESYRFDLGGRLYAPYQAMPKDQRDAITFDGERSVEADVRASHLTILLNWHGIDLDDWESADNADYSRGDPYLVGGPPTTQWRDAVKAYVTALCGKGSPPARWSPQAQEEHERRHGTPLPTLRSVADAVQRAYPCLKSVNDPLLWAKLQYTESEAMMNALGTLAGLDIPALPIHDALRVPASAAGAAIAAFRDGFYLHGGGTPYIRVK